MHAPYEWDTLSRDAVYTHTAVSSTNVNAIPAPSLTACEKEILARSASGLLSLHERVFEDLERVLSSLGGVSDNAGVEEAVKAVCGLFVREVRGFIYL